MSATPFDPLAKTSLALSILHRMLDKPATPFASLPDFLGAGIYAIYYSGPFAAYTPLRVANATTAQIPIYIGKADSPGGRQGVLTGTGAASKKLCSRIKEHRRSVIEASNLDVADFSVRWLVVDDIWIPLGESALIGSYQPLWNTLVDGFGNHDPGNGRISGVRSRWDTLHPGRKGRDKYPPRSETAPQIEQDIMSHFIARQQTKP